MTVPFSQLGLSKKTLAAVERLGYDAPTPVQAAAIPLVLKGKDIIAAAKTGTGKTAAFALPALSTLGHIQRGQGPLMLVVTPTRELALQIAEVCETIAQFTHHRIANVVGGVAYGPQISSLKRGVDVLIATPGRLLDLMEKNVVKLNHVEILVLDEGDRMLDMGFWPAVKRIAAATPPKRQTLLFSATIDKTITKNSGTLLKNPEFVEIAHRGETADSVDQYIIPIPQTLKPALLQSVLEEKGGYRVIVFTRTRSRSDSCARRLRRAGFTADAIHSDRSQAQRKRALDKFSSGKTTILVATDVLARGIDVSEVDYVVNYDIPNQPEDYIHRIGRTGRAGKDGIAISFVCPEQNGDLKSIEKLIKKEIPVLSLENFDQKKAELAARDAKTRQAQYNSSSSKGTARGANSAEGKPAKQHPGTSMATNAGSERGAQETEDRGRNEQAKTGGSNRTRRARSAQKANKRYQTGQQNKQSGQATQANRAGQTNNPMKARQSNKPQKTNKSSNTLPTSKSATKSAKKGTRQSADFRPGRAFRSARAQNHNQSQ